MTAQRVGSPQRGVTEVEVDGRISVYSPSTQQLVTLNETASDVWRLCDGEHNVPTIVRLLASSYQVEPDAIAGDVQSTVDELEALGLITASDAA